MPVWPQAPAIICRNRSTRRPCSKSFRSSWVERSVDKPETEDIEVAMLLEAIFAKYGYDLRDYSMGSMRRRARVALAKSGLSHFGELQHRALHDPEVFANLLEDLTVQVTDMFRDPSFYKVLRERVLPYLRA